MRLINLIRSVEKGFSVVEVQQQVKISILNFFLKISVRKKFEKINLIFLKIFKSQKAVKN